jgi:hypothetical protein
MGRGVITMSNGRRNKTTKPAINIDRLVEKVFGNGLVYVNGVFHLYNKPSGLYKPTPKDEIGHIIQPHLAAIDEHANSTINDYIGRIEKRCYKDPEEFQLYSGAYIDSDGNNVIHCRDRIVIIDMKTGEHTCASHSLEWNFKTGLAVFYDKTAICEVYDKFVSQKWPDKADETILDMFLCYILCGDCRLEQFLLLVDDGTGDTGKSTLINAWSAMLGMGLVSDVGLHKICIPPKQPTSFLPMLNDKLLNRGKEIRARL